MGYIKRGCVCRDCRCDFRKAIEFNEQGLVIAKEVGDKELEGKAYAWAPWLSVFFSL